MMFVYLFNPRHLEAYVRAESYDHLQGDEISLSDPVIAITDCIWVRTNAWSWSIHSVKCQSLFQIVCLLLQ